MRAIAKLTNAPKHLLSTDENSKYTENNKSIKNRNSLRQTKADKGRGPRKYNKNIENNQYSENIKSSKREAQKLFETDKGGGLTNISKITNIRNMAKILNQASCIAESFHKQFARLWSY